ncbi:MAG TPA: tripartite tricarboxylate transporter substrate binding protein [Burkholderiales bacterium]|nr:tripartite tricarboxylate transporter substrate binding protein [Burkholderiales bacterium]
MRIPALVLSASLAATVATAAQAQTAFPTRPVSLVLPSAPGDPSDLIARVLQPRMSERLGQQFVVENRPGGSGVIASSAVAKAAPDGHTLLLPLSAHSINPIALRNLPYDTFRDFAAVTQLARFPLFVGGNPSIKGSTLREFIEAARQHPGRLNFSSPGPGTLSFLVGEEINRRSGLNAVHLAFKGGAPAIQALLADQVQYCAITLNLLGPHFASGKLKPLAVTSAARSTQLPSVPTVAESGFPGFEAYNWIGVFAPAGTPRAVIARLHDEFVAAVREPDVRAKLTAVGMEVVGSTPEELDRFVRGEFEHWDKFVREFDLKFD